MVRFLLIAATALTVSVATESFATVVPYDEGVSGDASADKTLATSLGVVGAGMPVELIGSVGPSGIDKKDWFVFTSDEDFKVNLESFMSTDDNVSRFSLFEVGVHGAIADVRLGDVAGDIFGAFSAGSYMLRISEGSTSLDSQYGLRIAAVPLPAGFPLLLGALGGLAWMRRRRKA